MITSTNRVRQKRFLCLMRLGYKTKRFPTLFAGILAVGDLSIHVRSLTKNIYKYN